MKYLDRQFPLYTEAFRIGPPLLTQVRDAPDDMATDVSKNGWMVKIEDGASACWQFNVTGMMSHDSGCATQHSMDLPTLLSLATTIFSDLRDNEWIDKYTDYLVLDLSLYFPAQKVFSSLRLTVKQEDVGHLSTSTAVELHRLFQYENASDFVMLVSYIIFLSLFVVHLIKQVITIKKEGKKFFSSMWNIFALVSMIGSAAAICIFGIRYHSASEALAKLTEAKDDCDAEEPIFLELVYVGEKRHHARDYVFFALGDVAVGQNRSVTMVLHAFDVPTDAVIVVMQLSWWDHSAAFRVFFRYDTPPTEELYDDMKVQVDISGSAIRCNCNVPRPEAVIGGSLHVLPNSIDYDSIFRDPDILNDNNLVFYTVIAEWALYLGRKTDRSATTGNEKQLPQLSVLPPDRMPAPYLYQITVTTGSMLGAGTSARIGFQVFGSKSKTKVKMMNPDGESLLRGGSYDIIMPLKTSLGHLELLNIWHDNTGVDETSWFLKDIIVKDLQTEEVYQFICHDWLSEDRGDFQVQKVLHVATREQLGSFSNLFRENTDGMFYDQHLWTSSLVSPEGSSFTKSERLSCCCAVFNSMMLANAMWYKSDEGFLTKNFVYDLGFVQITLQEDWS
ncbi:uncharacterized protein LOC144865521 [Branchiostoma floridae x Branchiostoma japonicum]